MRLQFLHSPKILGTDGELHPLSTLDAALLASLAIHGATDRARLASLLWPARQPAQALTNLRQRLRHFRLHAPGLLQTGPGPVALGDTVTHDLQDPMAVLSDDADALPGPLLGHHDYAETPELAAWLTRERSRWGSAMRDILALLATRYEAEGRIAQALKPATRLAREDPANEHGVRLLMRLHHRRGDRGAALAAYEACVKAMNDAFGDPVSEETVQLAQHIARSGDHAPAPLPAMPLPLRHPPRTVAREKVVAAADLLWDGPGIVLLAGPAGIGKTRLFDELCRRWQVPSALRLDADDAGRGLGHLRRMLVAAGRAGHAAREGDGRPADRGRQAGADQADLPVELTESRIEDIVRGRSPWPWAIGVDDLQHADAESLEALMRLLRPHGAVRWLLTTRDAPLPAPVDSWLQRHDDSFDPLLTLQEFGPKELAAFVAGLGGSMQADAWATALHGHCGGNPLHVLQVLRAAHDEGSYGRHKPPATLPQPAALRAYVARRLDGSDEPTKQLAYVAALAGVDFDVQLASAVTGRRAADLITPWRRLEALGLMRGEEFAHDLVRQAVVGTVPDPLRPVLHRDIARALASHEGAHERRGGHWALAGHHREAARDLARAAEDAIELGLPLKARGLLGRAEQACLAAGETSTAFELKWRMGRLALTWESAEAAQQMAQVLARVASTDRQHCLSCCLNAQILAEQHDALALVEADRAVAWAHSSGQRDLLAQARLRRASALNVVGRWHDALALVEEFHDDAGPALRADDAQELVDVRAVVLAALGRRRESVADAMAARDRALAAGHWQRAAELASSLAPQLGYLCRTDEEIDAAEQAIDLCKRLGAERGTVYVDMMTLAGAYADVGRFREALETGERAAEGLREAGLTGWVINADNSVASMCMLLGRFDLAARRLPALKPGAPLWARAAREMMRGTLLHRRSGRSPLVHLRRAHAMFEKDGALLNPFVKHRIGVELAAWSPIGQALEGFDAAAAWARDNEHIALARIVQRMRVSVLLRHGRPRHAAAEADALEAAFDGRWVASNFYLPEVWQVLAMAWDASGQARRADAVAQRAREWLAQRLVDDVPDLFAPTFCTANAVNRWLLDRTGGMWRAGSRFDHAV